MKRICWLWITQPDNWFDYIKSNLLSSGPRCGSILWLAVSKCVLCDIREGEDGSPARWRLWDVLLAAFLQTACIQGDGWGNHTQVFCKAVVLHSSTIHFRGQTIHNVKAYFIMHESNLWNKSTFKKFLLFMSRADIHDRMILNRRDLTTKK